MPFPSLGVPGPGTKPTSPALAGSFFTDEPPGKPHLPNTQPRSGLMNENSLSLKQTCEESEKFLLSQLFHLPQPCPCRHLGLSCLRRGFQIDLSSPPLCPQQSELEEVTGKQVEGNKAGGKRCYFFLGVGGGLLALDCCKQAFL